MNRDQRRKLERDRRAAHLPPTVRLVTDGDRVVLSRGKAYGMGAPLLRQYYGQRAVAAASARRALENPPPG